MRKRIYLIGILIFWAAAAHGSAISDGSGQDVLGSSAGDTTIIAPEGAPVEVNILGSTASNIQIGSPVEASPKKVFRECASCGEEKRYETPWDDFKRPLCYPWSSYIPTRYNRPLIRRDQAYISTAPKVLTLGSVTTKAGSDADKSYA